MTDYARVTVQFEVSQYSDYGTPYHNPPKWVEELTPDEAFPQRVEAALSAGTTLSTSILSTCTMLAVKNRDTTNFVTLTWRSAANSSTDNKVRISPGDIFITQDVTAATNPTLVADTAACTCDVLILGT